MGGFIEVTTEFTTGVATGGVFTLVALKAEGGWETEPVWAGGAENMPTDGWPRSEPGGAGVGGTAKLLSGENTEDWVTGVVGWKGSIFKECHSG